MKTYILKDKKGNKMKLRVKDNKVYIVKTRLRKWVKYAILISLTILSGIIIASLILGRGLI